MQRKDIKILLLQIRDDQKVRREELESFAKYSQLKIEQIDVLNVFDTPHFQSDVLNGYDALYVCLLYTSPSPRDLSTSRMPSSA